MGRSSENNGDHGAGDHRKPRQHAAEELLPLVYEELRALAARHMKNERGDHTLQPTALVYEVYLRLPWSRGRVEVNFSQWR